MRFYNRQHQHDCGIDRHVKTMYVGMLDATGQVLAMNALHGGKAKNDQIDSHTIAGLLRGGLLPHAYVDPAAMRSTRDLFRRRLHRVRQRGQRLAPIQNTRAQDNLPAFKRRLASPANRDGVSEHFADPSVRKSMDVDLALIDQYDELSSALEVTLVRDAKRHDADAVHRRRSVPGLGKILAMTLLYEGHDSTRGEETLGPDPEDTGEGQRAVPPLPQDRASGLRQAGARDGVFDGRFLHAA